MIRSLSVLFAVAAIAGCSNPVDPTTDLITAHAEAKTLTLVNTSSDPVFYLVADERLLALLDWVPCVDAQRCNSVSAHSETQIPYSSIMGYTGSSETFVVYHWRAVNKGVKGIQPDSIRRVDVTVR